MHYKKRKLHKLHSIPIGLCNNRHLVSYSIPLSCVVVLLLTGIMAINPSLSLKTSAVTIQDEWVVKDNDSADTSNTHKEKPSVDSNTKISNPNNTPAQDINDANSFNNNNNASSNTYDDISNSPTTVQTASDDDSSDNDSGIMPLINGDASSSVVTPSISITVTAGTGGNGGGVDQVVNAFQGGSTVYRSHNVTVQGTMLKDYSLVLTGPTNLTMPSGASSSTSTVSGAGGKTGSNLTTNTWGYAWGNTTDTDSNMTYNSLSSSGTTISNNSTNSIGSDKSLNFTKKLVFAAKFGDVTPGNYTANVTLSAVATPAVSMSSISNMQDMTAEICEGSSDGQTATLTDSRDGKSYTIVKQTKDHHCWMQQNLQLNLTSGTAIEGSKNDGTAYSWTPTATTQAYSTSGTWTSDSTVVMSRAGNETNGNYYTWCAATAGTCSGATSEGQVASGSICPKGWHLPTGNTNGELYNLTSGLNMSSITASPYLFPATGGVYSKGSLGYVGSDGHYWSSTARSSTGAYILYFDSSNFYPGTSSNYRYLGYSVRCVAAQ